LPCLRTGNVLDGAALVDHTEKSLNLGFNWRVARSMLADMSRISKVVLAEVIVNSPELVSELAAAILLLSRKRPKPFP
jgi:hypothetical protein